MGTAAPPVAVTPASPSPSRQLRASTLGRDRGTNAPGAPAGAPWGEAALCQQWQAAGRDFRPNPTANPAGVGDHMPSLFAGARLRAMSSRRLRAGLVTAALTATALVSAVGTTTTEAHAATTTTSTTPSQPTAAQVRQAKINRVMTWAHNQRGKPYRYGAAGPSAFDCSGLTMYVF